MYEARPIEWMLASRPLEHFELDLAKRCSAPRSLFQISIVVRHQFAGRGIADGPKAHYQRFGPRQNERPPQSVNTLAVADLADARVARRKHNQFRAPEIEA